MRYCYEPMELSAKDDILSIFNYYVETSFAAFPADQVPVSFVEALIGMAEKYPKFVVKDESGNVVGFGMLHHHNPFDSFAHTADIAYFIHPSHTGKGIGSKLLELLLDGAREMGIENIIAGISSLNPDSIRFHETHGFQHCGAFKQVARKNGKTFDVVWMQKVL